MNRPKYVKLKDKLYAINTDFRVAIECDSISRKTDIGNYEKALAILYKLFGKDGLDCQNKDKLLQLGIKYISLGNEEKTIKNDKNNNYQLDFVKCEGLIRSSFKFDYNYDPYELEYLHWYDFYNDLCNLSTSEFGNCCMLNRVMSILNEDAKKIKDTKERTKKIELKKELERRYCIQKENKLTQEQEKSVNEFYKSLGIVK